MAHREQLGGRERTILGYAWAGIVAVGGFFRDMLAEQSTSYYNNQLALSGAGIAGAGRHVPAAEQICADVASRQLDQMRGRYEQ